MYDLACNLIDANEDLVAYISCAPFVEWLSFRSKSKQVFYTLTLTLHWICFPDGRLACSVGLMYLMMDSVNHGSTLGLV